ALANGFHEAVDGVRVNGPPRSVSKTNAPVVFRCRSRSMRKFVTPDRVNCGLAVLRSTDVQRRIATPFDLRPLQVGNLDGPQTVAKGHEDQRGVAVSVAPQLGGRDQLLDLVRRQVFAG